MENLKSTRKIALRDADTHQYVNTSKRTNAEFDPYTDMLLLHEFEEGYIIEHEHSGLTLSAAKGWLEASYEEMEKLKLVVDKKSRAHSIRINTLLAPGSSNDGSGPVYKTFTVEYREEPLVELQPFGPYQCLSKKQLKELEDALTKGGALLNKGEDQIKEDQQLGKLLMEYGKKPEESAEKEWINMKTKYGSEYSYIRSGNTIVYIWRQPDVSSQGKTFINELNSRRGSLKGEVDEKQVNEFTVIYRSGNQTTMQKFIGFSYEIANLTLTLVLGAALKKLIYSVCSKISRSLTRGAITESFALTAERAMANRGAYVRFFSWRTVATKVGRTLLSGLTTTIAVAAAWMVLDFIWSMIWQSQSVTICVYNFTKNPIACSVSHLDNVADHYYASNKEKGDINILSGMLETGHESTDPLTPGFLVDGINIYFGQYEMVNDSTFMEGMGTLLTLQLVHTTVHPATPVSPITTDTTYTFLSYHEVLIPYGKENKMAIGTTEQFGTGRETYNNLRKQEKGVLRLEATTGTYQLCQTINSLTGNSRIYTSAIKVSSIAVS